jgi:hypothetical protein
VLAGAVMNSVPESTITPVTINEGDAAGGSSPSIDDGAAAGTAKDSVGAAQVAIKISTTSAAAPPTGAEQETSAGFVKPGGYSGTNLTQAQLEALGFSPRREPQLHVSCVGPCTQYRTHHRL